MRWVVLDAKALFSAAWCKHFGTLHGRVGSGFTVLRPAEFLALH
jgi:hypothetical protein